MKCKPHCIPQVAPTQCGGRLIDFDDVSVVGLDGFWSGCGGRFLIFRLYHTSGKQNRHLDLVERLRSAPLLLCVFVACLFLFLLDRPRTVVFPFLPLSSMLTCLWQAHARTQYLYLRALGFASGCLCSAFFAHPYFWCQQIVQSKIFASVCDYRSFAVRGQPILTALTLALPRCHPFEPVAVLRCLLPCPATLYP